VQNGGRYFRLPGFPIGSYRPPFLFYDNCFDISYGKSSFCTHSNRQLIFIGLKEGYNKRTAEKHPEQEKGEPHFYEQKQNTMDRGRLQHRRYHHRK
jgi:hypothetical protein